MSEMRICPRCFGDACEEACGLRGGCEMAYMGPNSHRICRECRGAGSVPATRDVCKGADDGTGS